MPRKKVARDPISVLSGGVVAENVFGGRVRQNFLPLPVDRTLELRFDLGDEFDGTLDLDVDVEGARVKPVVFVPEGKVDLLDREEIQRALLAAGAKYVKVPVVHVVRTVAHRDERHDVEISLEESIRIFAEETKPRDVDEKVAFAAALARESDAGARE